MAGVLSFQNGQASLACMVRNLTDAGALIEIPHPQAPAAFELDIPARGLRGRARTVWRIGGRIGLRFEAVTASAAARAPARVQRQLTDACY